MIDFDSGIQKRKAPPIGAMNFTLIALVLSILGVVCYLVGVHVGAAVFGAIGLVMGGYAMGFIHKHGTGNIKPLLAIAGAALLLSVLGFMLGFIGIAGAL